MASDGDIFWAVRENDCFLLVIVARNSDMQSRKHEMFNTNQIPSFLWCLIFSRPILIQFDSYWCFHWDWGSHSCCRWIGDFVGAYKKKFEERKHQRRLRYASSKTSRNVENTRLRLVLSTFSWCSQMPNVFYHSVLIHGIGFCIC